ncbi:MAG: nucleotidyltransferase family protein [Candidatus Omnitrophica bacterium]|nr:nucleotidyltransferase family protein [Candidatus Omnitrophota bacterium]MDD5236213.1 nucleotidyltransferase family protein [Candidatus Omnitrophota bacterium]MDD5611063.1 nucleotidyltransferase family protein [Candidatus Omnitrophota bacterium]
MKALILAAGYAIRLYPLTKQRAKSLLLVRRKPIINYIVSKLEAAGEIDEIFVITNSKFISQFRQWKKGLDCSKRLRLIDDQTKAHEDRLGAIGDILFAVKKGKINDDLLVIGGDNLFDSDIKEFLEFGRAKKGHTVIGIFDLKNRQEAKRYGVIRLDKNSRIADFKEKPRHPRSALVAMCLYLFPKNKLRRIREYLGDRNKNRDATGYYIDWLRKKESVYGFVFSGRWYDIGDHSFYKKAKERFK